MILCYKYNVGPNGKSNYPYSDLWTFSGTEYIIVNALSFHHSTWLVKLTKLFLPFPLSSLRLWVGTKQVLRSNFVQWAGVRCFLETVLCTYIPLFDFYTILKLTTISMLNVNLLKNYDFKFHVFLCIRGFDWLIISFLRQN